MTGPVLIFPAGGDGADAFRSACEAQGRTVVGASSLATDPARSGYAEWETLPYVNQPDFDAQLAKALDRHAVAEVYAAHSVVWMHLSTALKRLRPSVRLLDGRAGKAVEQDYATLVERVGSAALSWDLANCAAVPKPPLRDAERLGLVRLVESIPGMCSLEKMLAVVEIMRRAPAGDVVEIGSWWGRSAFLFAWLARRYEVGATLCVDPWALEALPQGDPVLDAASAAMDVDQALRIFQINLAPLADGRVNYQRMRSVEGAAVYSPGLRVETEAFGMTEYAGEISVLHIDGNHAFDSVRADIEAWAPKVRPGGWVVFDDYAWPFGDGPKRTADAFVAVNEHRIAVRWEAGGALFVQLAA